jgi:hypothetical protein
MALSRLATNDPAHRGIVTQPFGVVHVLITSQAAEHRLPEQPCQCVPTVLAGARVGERLACHRGQSECVVKLAVCQQSRIGRDHGPAKLHHQATVKIQPDGTRFRFTRWVRHRRIPQSKISC